MAKGKHATALFEVMSKHRLAGGRTGSTPGGAIPTPKWWFKSKNRSDVKTMAPGEGYDPEPVEAIEEPVAEIEEPAPAPRRAEVVHIPLASSIDVPAAQPSSPAAAPPPPRLGPVIMSVDQDRQQISLKMSYTSALIGGFSLFIALALAVLIGKSLTRGPSTAIANTSTQVLRQNPPTPGVMNVPKRSDAAGANDAAEGIAARAHGSPSTGTRNPQTFNDVRPPATFFTDDPHRQNGLNYAIIQSYPDKESADKAAEFLTKSGIPCTVEKNLPNWNLPWSSGCVVVGIRGFAKVTNNPTLETYKKSILDASAKFTNGRPRFSGFSPSMYSWKKSN